jgi:hypothetical protein
MNAIIKRHKTGHQPTTPLPFRYKHHVLARSSLSFSLSLHAYSPYAEEKWARLY